MSAPPEMKRPPTRGERAAAGNHQQVRSGENTPDNTLPAMLPQARGRTFPHKPRTVRLMQLPTGSWHVADTWGVALAPFRDRATAVRHAVRHCRAVGAVPDERDPNAPEIAKRLNAQLKASRTRQQRQGAHG